MKKIFIVEDHPVMRRGFVSLFGRPSDLTICGEAGTADEARRRIPDAAPDLVIVDLSLQEESGLSLIKDLRAMHPDLLILVVSMHDESLYARRTLNAGANGYLMKTEADAKVVEAVREVFERGLYLSPALSSSVLLRHLRGVGSEGESVIETLTDRELEVFTLMGRGFARKEIAESLTLSPKTIDTYREKLKEKLSVSSNAELRRRAAIWVEMNDPSVL